MPGTVEVGDGGRDQIPGHADELGRGHHLRDIAVGVPAGSGVPNSRPAASPDSTRATCTHSSSAGSPAAYGRPVTASTPRTWSWIRRTRAAACSAAARSPKMTVARNAEVAASLPTGSRRQSLCWSTPAMASGCSACIIRARSPATGEGRSLLTRQVTLAGPKKPSSAASSGTPDTNAAADR